MKPELHCNPVGVPAGALSPPATLSPPGSPSVITLPSSPWSPGVPGSSSSTITSNSASSGLCQPASDRFSAFTLVSNYNPDLRLQGLPLNASAAARGKSSIYGRSLTKSGGLRTARKSAYNAVNSSSSKHGYFFFMIYRHALWPHVQ